jgi:hypothetical protein
LIDKHINCNNKSYEINVFSLELLLENLFRCEFKH